MEKYLLSDFLREKVHCQSGSIKRFADTYEMPYERLRKAFQRNSFSRDDLDFFVEKLRLADIDLSQFEHRSGRRTNLRLRGRQRTPLLSKTIEGIVPREYMPLVINNPIVLEKVRKMVVDECRRISDAIEQVHE